jgi:Family of unknown function (DUF5681)
MSASPAPTNDGDAVGYGRPPRRTRFQLGCSGNPKGRPKGNRGIDKMLQDALSRRVRVQEEGRARVLTVQEVIIRRLVNDAAKMDPRALKTLLSLMDRYAGSSETAIDMKLLTAEDEAILAGYMAEQKELGASDEGNSSAETNNSNPGARDAHSA